MTTCIRRPAHGDESGAVAVMVAILALAMFGLAAFATDVGAAYANRQQVWSASDSAALAATQQLRADLVAHPGWTCADLIAADAARSSSDPERTSSIAQSYVDANAPTGTTIVGGAAGVTVNCVGAGTAEVTVPTTKQSPTIFGGAVGVSSLTVNRVSRAAVGVANSVVGLRPIALCAPQVDAILANAQADKLAGQTTYRNELVTVDKRWGTKSCGSGSNDGSGNWGWLDLDPSQPPCSGNKLEDVIECGSAKPLTVTPSGTVDISGQTGNKGNSKNVATALESIMDDVVVLPVYDQVTGTGTNANFRTVGFVSVRMCGFSTQNKQEKGTCYKTVETRNPPGQQDISLVDYSLQLQFVDYLAVGNLSSTCGIGTLACDFRTYATRLTH